MSQQSALKMLQDDPPDETTREISPGQREQMIAEAAYYLAEQRGFDGGDPVQDWLQAESAINQQLHDIQH